MDPWNPKRLCYEELVLYTDNFAESNYIGRFQFGKLYHGKIKYSVLTMYFVVKIWEIPERHNYKPGDNELRLMEEITLLGHEPLISHPGIEKLYGYCYDDEHLGVVYDFKPLDSVFNLIPKEGFTWLQRIKAARGLASLLRFLHAGMSSCYKPFVVHNLHAAHIVLDEDYNPKLCDFGSITGGSFPNKRTYSGHDVLNCYGCIDIVVSGTDPWSNKQDVFTFGVILLSLISKRNYAEEEGQAGLRFVFEWALTEFEAFDCDGDMKNTEFSLVHKSLAKESGFCPTDGHEITMLALKCVNEVEHERPNMEQVSRALDKLEVVKQHGNFLEVKKLPHPCDNWPLCCVSC